MPVWPIFEAEAATLPLGLDPIILTTTRMSFSANSCVKFSENQIE